jgi:hypothetical protein
MCSVDGFYQSAGSTVRSCPCCMLLTRGGGPASGPSICSQCVRHGACRRDAAEQHGRDGGRDPGAVGRADGGPAERAPPADHLAPVRAQIAAPHRAPTTLTLTLTLCPAPSAIDTLTGHRAACPAQRLLRHQGVDARSARGFRCGRLRCDVVRHAGARRAPHRRRRAGARHARAVESENVLLGDPGAVGGGLQRSDRLGRRDARRRAARCSRGAVRRRRRGGRRHRPRRPHRLLRHQRLHAGERPATRAHTRTVRQANHIAMADAPHDSRRTGSVPAAGSHRVHRTPPPRLRSTARLRSQPRRFSASAPGGRPLPFTAARTMTRFHRRQRVGLCLGSLPLRTRRPA